MAREASGGERRLKIKKYPNRRFYDAAGSRHLTLGELHDLICDGYELSIVDSQSGEDITNLVLTQIILERDAPKLDIFPPNILHQVIRTKHKLLGSVVEQYFRQVLATQRASQERWSEFLKKTLGFAPPMTADPAEWAKIPSNPADWAKMFMPWAVPGADSRSRETNDGPDSPGDAAPEPPGKGAPSSSHDRAPADDPGASAGLKELAALRRRLDSL